MAKPKVLIYRAVDSTGESHRRLENLGCLVEVDDFDLADIDRSLPAADCAVLMGATFRRGRIDDRLLRKLPNLRLISKYTVGVDDVDLDAATRAGVLVTHCPTEANCGGVAEGTIAMMLACLKKVRERDAQVKSGGWRDDALRGVYVGRRVDGYAGLTVGIVGLGRIGSRVAELLRPWRCRLVGTDPYVDERRFRELGVESASLESVLRGSDVVSLHCTLTNETRGLLDAARLRLMKSSALLINTARGAIVDVDALCDALEIGSIAAAALDVFPQEPVPATARILRLGNRVLLSPHIVAANQDGTLAAAVPWATDAAIAALRGICPERVYNTEAIEKWTIRFGGKALIARD